MPRVQLPSNESSLPKVVRIHVNIDHVATLRNARGTTYPDPVLAARHCLDAGAHGITAHLREDRRHIRDEDVERLRRELRTTLNLEMAATDEMLAIARRIRPDVVTLVPERREERTTEGGLDVAGQLERLRAMCATFDEASIKTSLAVTAEDRARTLGALEIAAKAAADARLEVAAGHGLTVTNVVELMRISAIEELNVGHAVVADAIFSGIGAAVASLRAAVERGVRKRA
jgi:pyridoxine 5-phosphate synthase